MIQQDLQQIKEVLRSELRAELSILLRSETKAQLPAQLDKFTEEIILPAVENIIEDKLKFELEPIKKNIEYLKMEIGALKTRYPDKAYLDDKLSDLRGDFLANRKKDSARVDEYIKINYQRGNITKKDVEKLDKLRAFAPLPVSL